jgi:hypothetical protein
MPLVYVSPSPRHIIKALIFGAKFGLYTSSQVGQNDKVNARPATKSSLAGLGMLFAYGIVGVHLWNRTALCL